MGSSNRLSCETGSFSCHCNLHRFLQPEVLKLSFPTPQPWVVWSVSLPNYSFWFTRMQMWDHQSSATLLLPVLSPWLPVSAPPTGLDECFFFNSLVVGLLYSLIFWQFWLNFVFKFVIVLFIVQEGKVYLPTPPSWLEEAYKYSCSLFLFTYTKVSLKSLKVIFYLSSYHMYLTIVYNE